MSIKSTPGIIAKKGIAGRVGILTGEGIFTVLEGAIKTVDINIIGEIALLYMKKSGFSKLFHDELALNNVDLESHAVYYCSLTPGGTVHYITEPKPTGTWRTLFATAGGGAGADDYIGAWQKVSD